MKLEVNDHQKLLISDRTLNVFFLEIYFRDILH